MTAALVELVLLQMRGRFVRLLKLLRQPRYLIGYLVGAAYLLFVYGGRIITFGGHGRSTQLPELPPHLEVLPWLAAIAFAIILTLIWVLASAKPALKLSEAEINFLLPAPIRRRQVLAYALWKQQAGVLFGAAVVSFVRGGAWQGHRLERFVIFWALFTVIDLHSKGVSLWKSMLAALPVGRARLWRALVVAIFLGYWVALGSFLLPMTQSLRNLGTFRDFQDVAGSLGQQFEGPGAALLAPFAWITRPLFSGVLPWWGVLYLVALFFAHQEWVLRSRGAFEEATLARAQKAGRSEGRKGRREKRPASVRSRKWAPFGLAPLGRPEVAVVWKNLIQRDRRPIAWRLVWFAVIFVGLVVATVAFSQKSPIREVVQGLSLTLLFVTPPMCGLFLRNDLRSELNDLETVRTWPIPARRFVLAGMVAPVGTAIAMLLGGYAAILAVALANAISGNPGMPSSDLLFAEAGLVILGIPVAILSVSFQNLAALMFPSWILASRRRSPGAMLSGQRLLLFGAHVITLAVALIPAALLVGAVALIQKSMDIDISAKEAPLVALLATLPVWAEVAFLIALAGRRWEQLDPSRELLDRDE
jgi:ABC-2 type transport system permease protein